MAPGAHLDGPGDGVRPGAVRAVVALKAVAIVWSSVVVAIDADSGVLVHWPAAVAVLVAVAAWTVVWGTGGWRSPVGRWADAMLAAVVLAADELVYTGAHPQSLGSIWPLAAVIGVGILAGPVAGSVTGAAAGMCAVVAAGAVGRLEGNVLAAVGTALLLACAGAVAGSVTARIVRDNELVAALRARTEWAAELHDGVLQTLAVIQRRVGDPELVALAREQDMELRALLAGGGGGEVRAAGLGAALAMAAPEWTRRFDVAVRVVELDDGASVADPAAVRAVGELVANVAKHAGVGECTVSVDERDGGLVVRVHDEGVGFDPDGVEGRGLRGSVRGRVEPVGGTVSVRSAPGEGCDVELWLPRGPTLAARDRTGPWRRGKEVDGG